MTGDHHGRTARRATLLVRAADEILGTHRLIPHPASMPAQHRVLVPEHQQLSILR
jgi:hypothetical protein